MVKFNLYLYKEYNYDGYDGIYDAYMGKISELKGKWLCNKGYKECKLPDVTEDGCTRAIFERCYINVKTKKVYIDSDKIYLTTIREENDNEEENI